MSTDQIRSSCQLLSLFLQLASVTYIDTEHIVTQIYSSSSRQTSRPHWMTTRYPSNARLSRAPTSETILGRMFIRALPSVRLDHNIIRLQRTTTLPTGCIGGRTATSKNGNKNTPITWRDPAHPAVIDHAPQTLPEIVLLGRRWCRIFDREGELGAGVAEITLDQELSVGPCGWWLGQQQQQWRVVVEDHRVWAEWRPLVKTKMATVNTWLGCPFINTASQPASNDGDDQWQLIETTTSDYPTDSASP